MRIPKLKNKINPHTGGLQCGGFNTQKLKGCGKDAGIGQLIKGVVYCKKCWRKIKEVKK